MELNQLGSSGPTVTTVGVGTSPLGGMPQAYGHDVDEASAVATVRRVLQSPINFIDTSNEYSAGESERRIGVALREAPLPENFVIATKADPLPGERSFTGQRVLQSWRESAERLGVDHFKVYYLQDPERFDFAMMTAPGGAVQAMVQLKAEGLVGAIGVAGGDLEEMQQYVDTGAFDILLNHSQYNLLDRARRPTHRPYGECGPRIRERCTVRERHARKAGFRPAPASSTAHRPRPSRRGPTGCGRNAHDSAFRWPRSRSSSRRAIRGFDRRSSGSPRQRASMRWSRMRRSRSLGNSGMRCGSVLASTDD